VWGLKMGDGGLAHIFLLPGSPQLRTLCGNACWKMSILLGLETPRVLTLLGI
jgi:hypothetical protein